jgi:phage recombination protein Bet
MSSNVVAISTNGANYTAAQTKLIKDTVAKDCNAQEFDLFVTVARNAGLDPFRKQISAIVFSKGDADKRRMSIITTIDGLRVIAARSRRYRPDEDEPLFEYDPALKGPDNPLGLVKAVVKIYIADDRKDGGWRPVTGVAYWSEFAALKEEVAGGFDWVDTGDTWPDTGKPKKRKVPRNEGALPVPTADGNWAKMPRVMLAKCAEAQALRKAFPEDLSGLYEGAELDRAQAAELSPSEMIGQFETESRLAKIGAANGITFQLFPNGPLESIALGQVADRVMETVTGFGSIEQIRWFESANTHPLREFWARAPTDGLALKKHIEAKRAELERAASAPQGEA